MAQIEDAFRFLDSAEARAALRVSKSKLNKLVKDGKLRRSAVCRTLFPLSEVRRFAMTLAEPMQEAR